MPVQDALTFLREARRDENLSQQIAALDENATLESLSGIGGRAGFRFTPDELRRAHALDWSMRWKRYESKR
jgi:hypothetical protein